jgi:hypothetical protein
MPGLIAGFAAPCTVLAAEAAPEPPPGPAGLAAAGIGCPGDAPFAAETTAGTAFGTDGVSVPVLVVVGGFGGDAGPPPPA